MIGVFPSTARGSKPGWAVNVSVLYGAYDYEHFVFVKSCSLSDDFFLAALIHGISHPPLSHATPTVPLNIPARPIKNKL